MNGLLVFPCHKTNKKNKQTNKKTPIELKKKSKQRKSSVYTCMFLKTNVTFSGRTLGGGSITADIIMLSSILK